ncbi:PREDICTED: probable F-box protein At5g47300 [Camelina sativa]|uniref:Probable F-box protein At5g47300 n=1 Tax=Camelina sativa TaxID=90675 RepID=A0ABM1RP99_CAMSA|nr:PREDICTED: probable F-box protein At5g47300 [Camelina sativa]
MSDLPKDLVEEILCRVPASYLSELRYTCKRWNRLFNKKRFTRKHLDKAAKQFLVLMSKQDRVCLISVNFCGVPSVEIKGEQRRMIGLDEFEIFKVSHCDSLLLCNNKKKNRIVVWNPCTGQTRWIQPTKIGSYALGSYQDQKYGDTSYKILSCCVYGDNNEFEILPKKKNEFEIYEFNTNSWRTLDVTLDCELDKCVPGMSLKGKTYWFASDEKEEQLGMFLVCFDYTTEIFDRLLFPCKCLYDEALSLSVVREEKLSVLLQRGGDTLRREIWVTNKIDEAKVVSWSKFLTVDMKPECSFGLTSFLVDEEKKSIVLCHLILRRNGVPSEQGVYIVGEDNNVKQVHSGFVSSLPNLFDYVPSLTQI